MTLERLEIRLQKTRRVAWVLAAVISFPVSYLLMLVRAPTAPWWLALVCGCVSMPIVGAILARSLVASTSDLLIARLGTADERRRRLLEPPTRHAPGTTRAAIALEIGELGSASALLGGIRSLDRKQPLFHLVTQRKSIITGDPTTQAAAIDALLDWQLRGRVGLRGEIARYHAFVLATSLSNRPADDPQVIAAVARLRASPDFEIRAYATWLSTESPAPELLAGAALARAATREPLAQSLELRAARLSSGERTPYRDGS